MTTPHLMSSDIWMQPDSLHHAQGTFAQGLGPYAEIPYRERSKSLRIVCGRILKGTPSATVPGPPVPHECRSKLSNVVDQPVMIRRFSGLVIT